MDHDILYPLRRLHGRLHGRKIALKRKFSIWRRITFPFGEKVFIPGTPLHTNLGDSAIVIAQTAFLCRLGIPESAIKEISFSEYYQNRNLIRKCVKKNHVICSLGGGNMGNQWGREEQFRYDLMADYPDNPLIIFPQTLFFTDGPDSARDKERSISYYNNRPGLVLTAREQKSYVMMKELYPQAKVILTPDIVLSANMETFGVKEQPRSEVLLCMRSDAEKRLTEDQQEQIAAYLRAEDIPYRFSDMHADCAITSENRMECVQRKMLEFARAKLVITDRLHGMIFAAITGTPCVVFSNYNHKVRGTYEWIKYLPYIKYAESVEEAKSYIPELLTMKGCQYDNTPLLPYFEKLVQVVKEYADN